MRVVLGPPGASEVQGAVFFERGEITDAHFEEWEGLEALRRMVSHRDGKYEVEVGPRSVRRTVQQPWTAVAGLLRGPLAVTPPALRSVESTPPPGPVVSGPGSIPRLVPVPQTGERPAPVVARPVAVPPPSPPARVAAPAAAATATATATARRTTDPGALPADPGAGTGPRPIQASGPRTAPFQGPGPGEGPVSSRHTAPFSALRTPPRRRQGAPTAVLILLAIVVGGGLAAAVSLVVRRARAPEPAPVVAAAPAPAQPPAPAVAGVSDTEVVVGMAAPLTGASKELGRQMKIGLDAAFEQANAAGGVNGRKVKFLAMDDGYEPTRTREVMRDLAEQKGVFGFVGNVGTPTAAVAVPYALERKMLFFGPFTGASLLRKEPPDRYVFNYRASYIEETAAIVRYLVEVRRVRPDRIAVFAQDDSFGEAGFQGVAKGLRQYHRAPNSILRVSYKRNTADVTEAVDQILKDKQLEAVVMVATYRPAAHFIEKVRDQRPGMIFSNVSFVGSQALAEELVQLGPKYAQGIIVTQVVPLPTGQSTVAIQYRDALARYAAGEKPDFVSFEGYVAGNLLVEGLRRAGRNLSTEDLVNALESIHGLDIGLGVPLGFGMSEHQASHKVWGTVLDAAGAFQPLDLD